MHLGGFASKEAVEENIDNGEDDCQENKEKEDSCQEIEGTAEEREDNAYQRKEASLQKNIHVYQGIDESFIKEANNVNQDVEGFIKKRYGNAYHRIERAVDINRGDYRGDMNRRDMYRGDINRGDMSRGDMNRGDINRGDIGQEMQRARGERSGAFSGGAIRKNFYTQNIPFNNIQEQAHFSRGRGVSFNTEDRNNNNRLVFKYRSVRFACHPIIPTLSYQDPIYIPYPSAPSIGLRLNYNYGVCLSV
ncbi:hypothetical protein HF086_014216 [Spodoptera exigua]|uniref:Uncharacterized protein n=1 Tax=Spodoptera exigua TaxID=7107 RepID=A0A922SH58_SPOEX|nr:hypothetical protein HF086_014216 [Spodoptera exigua]